MLHLMPHTPNRIPPSLPPTPTPPTHPHTHPHPHPATRYGAIGTALSIANQPEPHWPPEVYQRVFLSAAAATTWWQWNRALGDPGQPYHVRHLLAYLQQLVGGGVGWGGGRRGCAPRDSRAVVVGLCRPAAAGTMYTSCRC